MRSPQVRSSSTSASRIAFQARGPSISSITMMVRVVIVAAILDAAFVNAPRIVSWLPASSRVTWPGVIDDRRSRTWKFTSK